MAQIDEGEIRMLLDDERTRLQQIRRSLADSTDLDEGQAPADLSSVDQHPADAATETFERERDRSILEHIDVQLADVDHAVERLRAGTYGTCEACGRPIDDDRLRARPAARYCVGDQARMERGRGVAGARPG